MEIKEQITINPADPEYKKKVQEYVASQMSDEDKQAIETQNAEEQNKETHDIELPNKRRKKKEVETQDKPKVTEDAGEDKKNLSRFEFEDDLGEKVSVEADLSDTEYVTNLLRVQKKFKELEEENQAMKDMTASQESLFKKKEEELAEIIKLSKMSKEEQIEYLMKDIGGKEAYEKSIIEQYRQYEQMTEDERKAFDSKRAEVARKQREEALVKKHEEALAEIQKQKEELHKNSRLNMTRLAFGKHRIEGDTTLAKDSNQAALTEANRALSVLESKGITLTQAIIDREMSRAMQPRRRDFNLKKRSAAEVQDEMDKATASAQEYISKERVTAGSKESKAQTFRRWSGLVSEGKSYEISKELAADKSKSDLFVEFAESVKFF